jgi:hypothetical protein
VSGYDVIDHRAEKTPREPVCGEDFCENCGDCLVCYWENECVYGGNHLWLIETEEESP